MGRARGALNGQKPVLKTRHRSGLTRSLPYPKDELGPTKDVLRIPAVQVTPRARSGRNPTRGGINNNQRQELCHPPPPPNTPLPPKALSSSPLLLRFAAGSTSRGNVCVKCVFVKCDVCECVCDVCDVVYVCACLNFVPKKSQASQIVHSAHCTGCIYICTYQPDLIDERYALDIKRNIISRCRFICSPYTYRPGVGLNALG